MIPSFIPSQFVSPHARALSASHLSLSLLRSRSRPQGRSFTSPDMTESWGHVCVHCAELLARVPLHIILVAVLASLVGLFVLVGYRCCPCKLTVCKCWKLNQKRTIITDLYPLFYGYSSTSSSTSSRLSPDCLSRRKRNTELLRKMEPSQNLSHYPAGKIP